MGGKFLTNKKSQITIIRKVYKLWADTLYILSQSKVMFPQNNFSQDIINEKNLTLYIYIAAQ